jgi:hypothetical protein
MRESSALAVVSSSKIGGSAFPARKNSSGPSLFGQCAKLAWDKPDMVIADIAGLSDRQARNILRGDADVPLEVGLALLARIVKRK